MLHSSFCFCRGLLPTSCKANPKGQLWQRQKHASRAKEVRTGPKTYGLTMILAPILREKRASRANEEWLQNLWFYYGFTMVLAPFQRKKRASRANEAYAQNLWFYYGFTSISAKKARFARRGPGITWTQPWPKVVRSLGALDIPDARKWGGDSTPPCTMQQPLSSQGYLFQVCFRWDDG